MASTIDSLPTDIIGLSCNMPSACMLPPKSIDNSMSQASTVGVSLEGFMVNNTTVSTSNSTAHFQSLETGTSVQVQVPSLPVFKTETLDMSLPPSIPSIATSTSPSNPVSIHSHTTPVPELTNFEPFYSAPSQDSFESSYGSTATGSMTGNQLPMYETHVSQGSDSIQLQNNNSLQYETSTSVQSCSFTSSKGMESVVPIDLTPFQTQTEVTTQEIAQASTSTVTNTFCPTTSSSATTVVVDSASVVNGTGLTSPQAIQSINVMSQMTDNELLGFINPSTFD